MQQPASAAVDAAQGLRELIWANRDRTEERRQLADPVVDALVDSGLGRLALANVHGGLELPPTEALEVLETLAAAEAAVAWIVWNSSLPCWLGRFLGDDARNEIFSDRRALFASSTRPSGKAVRDGDAYIVNGRWSLVSGCLHAAWIPVMCIVEKDGETEMLAPNRPHMRMLYVPRDAFTIHDTWYVGGLKGTGSHDVELRDQRVPALRSFAMGDLPQIDSAFGRMPIVPVMAAGGASICLGIADAALRALLELASGKASIDGGPGLKDRPPVQALVAELDTRLQAIRLRLRACCERAWQSALDGTPRNLDESAALFGAAIVAAEESRDGVNRIYAAAGASSLYTASPIERAHRDIHAVCQHIVLQPFWLEQAGRVRLGLEPTHPMFML